MTDVSKFRDDIEEALKQGGADRLPSAADARTRARRRPLRVRFDPRPSSPGQVALVGIVLLALAYFRVMGGLSGLALNVGLALLVLAALSWLVRPRRRTVIWRERRIDLTSERSWIERLYYVIYRGS